MEGLDRCFQGFEVEAKVRLDLVMPVNLFVYAFELMPFLLVDAVEASLARYNLKRLNA